MALKVGEVYADLKLNTGDFNRGLANAKKSVSGLAASISGSGSGGIKGVIGGFTNALLGANAASQLYANVGMGSIKKAAAGVNSVLSQAQNNMQSWASVANNAGNATAKFSALFAQMYKAANIGGGASAAPPPIIPLKTQALMGLQSAVGGVKSAFSGLASSLGMSTGALGAVAAAAAAFVAIGAIVVVAVIKIVSAMIQFGKQAIAMAAGLEQVSIAMKTMLKDGEASQALLEDLRQFANETPFDFEQLIPSAQKLLAFGFAAQDIIPLMTDLGDAVSGLGGGQEMFAQLTRALGQMHAKGSRFGEEMLQLTEVGIPAWEFLAKALNTDVAGAMKKVQSGAVSADTAIKAIRAGMKERFGGGMAEQSKTWIGLWSSVKDKLDWIFRDIGSVLLPIFKPIPIIINKILDLWEKFRTGVQALKTAFKPFIDEVAAMFGKVFSKAGDNYKRIFSIFGTEGKAAFGALIKGLQALVPILRVSLYMSTQFLMYIQMAISELIGVIESIFNRIKGFSLIERLIETAVLWIHKTEQARAVAHEKLKQQKEEAKLLAEEEAKAVLDVVEANKEAKREEAERRAQAMSWLGVKDLWKNAQLAAVRISSTPPPSQGPALTSSNLPDTETLKKILESNRTTEKNQAELLRITRERLGLYAT